MSLYPTLEDMKVDHMMKVRHRAFISIIEFCFTFYPNMVYHQAQLQAESQYHVPPRRLEDAAPSAPAYNPSSAIMYPSLGEYMGLELTEEMIAENMPEYSAVNRASVSYIVTHSSRIILNFNFTF